MKRIASCSKTRLKEIIEYMKIHDINKTLKKFNIKENTLKRYNRDYKKFDLANFEIGAKQETKEPEISNLLKAIGKRFNEQELKAIARGSNLGTINYKKHKIDFNGKHLKIGFMTDTHIGSIFFNESWFFSAIEEMEKQKIDLCFHAGDVTDGFASNRAGHVFTLNKIGYQAQKTYAIELFSKCKFPVYMIDGNHDRFYIRGGMGGLIVQDICDSLENLHYLGSDYANIDIDGIKLELFHGEDSAMGYSVDYRIKKYVEALPGCSKPNILFFGHCHKMMYIFLRNIHCFSGGALSEQSDWMRSKKIENIPGFFIIDLVIGDHEIKSCKSQWFPFY